MASSRAVLCSTMGAGFDTQDALCLGLLLRRHCPRRVDKLGWYMGQLRTIPPNEFTVLVKFFTLQGRVKYSKVGLRIASC